MNTKTLKRTAAALLPAALLAWSGCSSPPQLPPISDVPPAPPVPASPQFLGSGVAAGASSGMVRVLSVDHTARTALLQRADGTTATYQAGPEAVNFDRVKAGDSVMTTVTESYEAYLVPGGVTPSAVTNVVAAGKPRGSQPGGVMIRTVNYNAKVLDVNYATRRVLLQYGANQAKGVDAGPDINLAGVQVGNDVLIKTTEAMAIAVVNP